MTETIPTAEAIPTVVTPWWSEEEEGLEEAEIVDDVLLCDESGAPLTESAGWEAPATGKPRDPLATATLAEIYLSQGFHDQALQIYRDLAEAEPGNGDLLRRIADIESLQAAAGAPEIPGTSVSGHTKELPERDDGRERTLAVLEQWLENIERRRTCH